MKSPEILKSSHVVMSYELDSWGHVNNAVYLNYLEKARNDFMAARGLGFQDFSRWQKFPVVRKACLEFRSPATAGDRLVIEGRFSHHSATSFTLSYQIKNSETGKPVLLAETFHIFVNQHSRPTRIPEEFFNKFLLGIPEKIEEKT